MAKNDNAHALRMADGIERVAGSDEARRFSETLPLSKSADIGKKHAWAAAACAYLEERFDEETIRRIRWECRCNDGRAIADRLLKYLKRNESLQAFVEDFNRNEDFASLVYEAEDQLLFLESIKSGGERCTIQVCW